MKWKVIPLGSIALQDKRIVQASTSEALSRPYLGLEQIEPVTGRILRYESFDVEGKSNAYMFEPTHVLYGKLRPYLNKVALPERSGRCSTEIIPLIPKGVDRDFLAFLLRSDLIVSAAMQEKTGSRMPRANMEHLMDLDVGVPCEVEDQRRIAARLKAQLDEVEKARKAAELQLADAKLLRSRLIVDIFKCMDNAPMEIISDWAETASGSTPSRGNKDYWTPHELPWVKTTEVAFMPIVQTDEYVSKRALQECSLKMLPKKTVLVAMYGQGKTRGQSALLEVEATTNQACFAILPNEKWMPEFMQFWMQKSYNDLRTLSEDRGGNQANLNGAILKGLRVPAPPIEKQAQVVSLIKDALIELDHLNESIADTFNELKLLPQKILSEAFGEHGGRNTS